MNKFWRYLLWIIPLSLAVGLALALLSPGIWWKGWLAYGLVCTAGFSALAALWRSAGGVRSVTWMLLVAVVLRLGLGIAFSYILPPYGNDTPVQNAGYIFSDSFRRDSQAWELATSPDSLLKAFDKTYSVDQYGGLLLTSSLLYRFISPDAHRPWLIILLAAFMGAIGAVLAYKASKKAWGDSVGLAVGWMMALFPEAILLGSSQMREPFLIAFVAMLFWGAVGWSLDRWRAAAWAAGGILGLLFFSPGIAVMGVIVIAAWLWLDRKKRQIKWWLWAGAAGLVLLAGVFFTLAISTSGSAGAGIFSKLIYWLRYSVQYDSSLLEHNSGWVQEIFKHVPTVLHLPFIIVYGVLQPVLPAAIGDVEGVWPMYALGIVRGLGWFAMLPALVYAPFLLGKITEKQDRLKWFWLWAAMLVWILISSARGGGDQWDNPRYRTIFLIFETALTVKAFQLGNNLHARGLYRLIAVEGLFVLCFSAWTITRYDTNPFVLPLAGTFAAFIIGSVLILAGDWLWVALQNRKRLGAGRAIK